MSKKIYVLKEGEVNHTLTTVSCLGTNDVRKFPVDADGKPVEMVANFNTLYNGKMAYITEDPIEIELITNYLMKAQNPYFYDLDNPENSRLFYKNLPEEVLSK